MSNDQWRWADPNGQQRNVRLDELRAALAGGHIAPNTPVWKSGWKNWQSAHEVPELTSSALAAANGVVPNIPPPPLAMVAVQAEFEAKAVSFSQPPPAPDDANDEPPPPPQYVPLPVKANSIPPPAASSGRLPSPAAAQHISLPTAIGLPPPPELAALAEKARAAAAANGGSSKNPMVEELSGSMLLDDSQQDLAKPAAAPAPFELGTPVVPRGAPMGDSLPPPTDPIVHGGPSIPPEAFDDAGLPGRRFDLKMLLDDFKEIKAGRPPKNKLQVGVVGVFALMLLISFVALIISAFSGKPSGSTAGSGSSSAMASSSAPGSTSTAPAETASAAPTAATTTAPPEEKPTATDGTLGDCTLAGEAHVVSPRAFGGSGVETVAVPGAIALGFAVDPRTGVAVTVDPASIGITTTVRARAVGGDAKRMSPVLERGKLTLVPGVDKKVDKLQGRRVVNTNPPIDIGIADGNLVWAPHDQNSWAKLFAVEGDGAIDAIRAVPLGTTKGIAVTLRRGNAVYVGVAKGDAALAPEGSLAKIAGLGQVGSPSIATSGDTILVAWSDRATGTDPWQVRWTKLSAGGEPAAPKQLTLPEGGLGTQAMSPAIAGLGSGRFLMTWSEGMPTHQVRAITMNADGSPSGAAMALSAAGVNAGQPQVAVGSEGRGVVAFLALKGKGFEIHATPVSCAAK